MTDAEKAYLENLRKDWFGALDDTLDAFRKEVRADLKEVRTEVKELRGDVAAMQVDIATMQVDIATIQGNMTTMQGDIIQIKDHLGLNGSPAVRSVSTRREPRRKTK